MKNDHQHALLIEITIAVLCFAVASTVIVRTFAAARIQSDKSKQLADVVLAAENLADSIYLKDYAELDSLFVDNWVKDEAGMWQKTDGGILWRVSVADESGEAGVLRKCVVSAEKDGETLISLPCSRYFSIGEATP